MLWNSMHSLKLSQYNTKSCHDSVLTSAVLNTVCMQLSNLHRYLCRQHSCTHLLSPVFATYACLKQRYMDCCLKHSKTFKTCVLLQQQQKQFCSQAI